MAFNDGRVVSNFITQVIDDKPVTLFGDGEQTRSFCFVSDLIEGLFQAARVATFDPPVNLGNPKEFTMRELASTVMKVAGKKVDIVNKPLPSDDPRRRCPDITKAKKQLGFAPKIALEEGIRQTYENFEARLAKWKKDRAASQRTP
jgi:UDP-glucuronate decarboxylase